MYRYPDEWSRHVTKSRDNRPWSAYLFTLRRFWFKKLIFSEENIFWDFRIKIFLGEILIFKKKSNKELIRVKVEQKRMKRKNLLPGINKINPMINDSMNRLTIGQMIEVSFNLRKITFSTENHVISTYSLGKYLLKVLWNFLKLSKIKIRDGFFVLERNGGLFSHNDS